MFQRVVSGLLSNTIFTNLNEPIRLKNEYLWAPIWVKLKLASPYTPPAWVKERVASKEHLPFKSSTFYSSSQNMMKHEERSEELAKSSSVMVMVSTFLSRRVKLLYVWEQAKTQWAWGQYRQCWEQRPLSSMSDTHGNTTQQWELAQCPLVFARLAVNKHAWQSMIWSQ